MSRRRREEKEREGFLLVHITFQELSKHNIIHQQSRVVSGSKTLMRNNDEHKAQQHLRILTETKSISHCRLRCREDSQIREDVSASQGVGGENNDSRSYDLILSIRLDFH